MPSTWSLDRRSLGSVIGRSLYKCGQPVALQLASLPRLYIITATVYIYR
jgi:hypothetical protein